ncbi:MAG: thioesterase family protein [Kiritimatiellia bacterium]|nr:thioesterase family protein [Kiritimatiellia bacterium]
MERLKIDVPDTLEFQTELEVRIGDVNYGGHLGNDAVLALLQEARLRFLAQSGFSEKDAGGCGLIMMDASIQYVSQAFHGDRLRVEIGLGVSDRIGFELLCRIRNVVQGRDVARARTGFLFFDYARGKPARMPELFKTRMIRSAPTLPQESHS